MSPWRSAIGLVFALVVTFSAAAFGALFTAPGVAGHYQDLAKPSWTPPDGVFGPVWTVLYTLMAVAAWLVWRQGGWRAAGGAMTLYLVQLAMNAAWSPVFFGLGWLGAAFALIVALWLAIMLTAMAFVRHSRLAAGLLVPYLAWVGYATALNFAIWRMNG
jgi:benzodiazapine receptor